MGAWAERNLSLYGIYDTSNADCCVGIFTKEQALKYLQIKKRRFYQVLKNNIVCQCYRVEYVGKGDEL